MIYCEKFSRYDLNMFLDEVAEYLFEDYNEELDIVRIDDDAWNDGLLRITHEHYESDEDYCDVRELEEDEVLQKIAMVMDKPFEGYHIADCIWFECKEGYVL